MFFRTKLRSVVEAKRLWTNHWSLEVQRLISVFAALVVVLLLVRQID